MWTNLFSLLVGFLATSYYYKSTENTKKEKEALDAFNYRKEEFINSFQKQLENDFSNKINFCKEEISSKYDNYKLELNKYIDKITKIENRDNLFNNKINIYLDKMSEKMSKLEVNHLNILLIGLSGVGKSFLINSVLKLENEKKAETQIIKPTTRSFNIYESNKIPNIRLIDSRGIEKGNYNIDALVKEITNYIENQELKGNPDNFIHCIWYCMTGNRFEDIEEETLLKLSSIYDDSKLPIIVVYTQAINPAYYNAINKEINKIKKGIEYIPVLAEDMEVTGGTIVKSYNLDLLLIKSLEKSKNAVYSSVFSAIRKIVINEIDFQLEKNSEMINNNLNKIISSLQNNTSKIDINEERLYNEIFKSLLYEEESKKDLKSESKKIINDLINSLIEINNKVLGKCLNDYIKTKSNDLSSQLLDIQAQVNREHNGNLKQYINRKEIKEGITPFILSAIQHTAGNIGFLHYIKIIPLKIVDLLLSKIKKEYSSIITGNSAKNILNKKIQSQFQNILSEVKKFKF